MIFDPNKLYKSTDPELRPIGTEGSLAILRHRGEGPAYHKLGSRVYYKGCDLEKYVEERRIETHKKETEAVE